MIKFIGFILLLLSLVLFSYIICEAFNKGSCYNLPPNEFYSNARCEKYVNDWK